MSRTRRKPRRSDLWIAEHGGLLIALGIISVVLGFWPTYLSETGDITGPASHLVYLPAALGAAVAMTPRNARKAIAAYDEHQRGLVASPTDITA